MAPHDTPECDTPDALVAWARAYAREVVAAHDLCVDLSLVEWEVSHRAKRRAGAVKAVRPPDATVGVPYDWAGTDPPYRACTVSLTWEAYEALGHERMAGTVRHELVHVEQHQRYGTTDHGAAFEARADDLDAPLSCPHFAEANYHLHCAGCGALVARRYRRSKLVTHADRYRSRCCGAALSVE
jgi:hypothetical protein